MAQDSPELGPLTLSGKPPSFGTLARIGGRAIAFAAGLEATGRVEAAASAVRRLLAASLTNLGPAHSTAELISHAHPPAMDEFFALGPVT